jgi:PAS domain S-box-containing protein
VTLLWRAVNLSRQHASQVAGFAALTIAAVGFVGWWASVPLLSSWGSGFATVKPTTALCLAALGLALMHPGPDSRFTFAVGLTVAAIAALDLLDLFGVDTGINVLNRLLVPRAAAPGPETSFSMINGVPVTLLLSVGALVLSRFERHRFAATALSGVVGVLATFALLNYLLTGSRVLYGTVELPTPLTAIGQFCVAGAIISRIGTIPALRKPRPLWHLLIVLGCAIITPLLLFGVYMGLHITDAELRDVRNGLMSEARMLSSDVDREITGEIERLQALAASASLRQGDFAEFQRQAEASLAWRQSGNVALIDRNMQEIINTSAPFGAPLGKAAVPASVVEKSLATGKPQVAGLFIGATTRRLMFSVIVPAQINDDSRYVLARSPDLLALGGLIAAKELPPGWRAAVSDAARRIIARSDQGETFVGTELPQAQRHHAAPSGIFQFADSEGRPSLEAYVRSELTGWQTAVWAPTAQLEARVRTLWSAIAFASLLAFALVFAFALWLGRIVARSVGQAARATIALKKGAPLPLSETPVAEVETLMEELRQTAAELRETAARREAAERDLQASKDHLQLAFDATQLGWWQYDPCRRMISGDARFKEIFDVTTDEISVEGLMKRVHPDDREMFRANRDAALDPANPEPYVHHQYRVRRRDGAVRWVEADGLAYFEGVGPERRIVSFGGTIQDITERKEREEKEHLLMREINHRAKNILSVVASIAHQTAARNPDDFVERFGERIQALSANQDLLVRSEWSGVEIADLVRAQLAHFADLIGSRIAVQGPKLRLNPASAQAIGLALHELATNAGKYGALSNSRGRVEISWGTAAGVLTMTWSERDGPPVSAPRQRGFGSVVVEAMAERSVGGEVHLDFATSGVAWRLTCPAANALEPGSGMRTGADSDS